MAGSTLVDHVSALADELGIPGVAVGVLAGEETIVACHGVTSVDNPLPVDESTLFQFGSTGKTYTAVALLRLVERGDIELEAPVRRYVPDLRLRDEGVAERVTVLQLLNHTAGWDGDWFADTGGGDDALARFVTEMARLEQVSPPGEMVSYNNASLALAGHVVERVTGLVFERALEDLVLAPADLEQTLFEHGDVMTHRFAVGHGRMGDEPPRVLRPWRMPRSCGPMGGLVASVRDQLAWARLHLEGGRTADGEQLLSAELAARMQEPTVHCPGSALGDAIGISWLLGSVDDVRTVSHGGATLGQLSAFTLSPDHGFAVVSMTNCSPHGALFNRRVVAWARERWLGVRPPAPVLAEPSAERLAELEGTYRSVAMQTEVRYVDGSLVATTRPTEAVLAQLGEDADDGHEPVTLHLLDGDGDRWTILDGPEEGRRGFFTRGLDGTVSGLHAGGRFAPRAPES